MTAAPLLVDRLREHARTIPDALALRAPGGERTMAELVARAEAIAARLRAAGCAPGNRVAVIGRPSLAWVEVMLGAMFARAAFTPMSSALTPDEHRLLLADAQPLLVFADGEFTEACPPDRTIPLDTLDAWLAAVPGSGEPAQPQGGDLFSIIYSSGTTGVPKGIAHTAAARAEFIHARPRPGFGPGRTGWVSTALCTNFSFLGMITPWHWGAAVSIPARFSVEGFFAACARERISDVSLVPVQVRRILEHPDFATERLDSLRFTMISGSPLDLATKRRLVAEWPGRIVDSYGTTETGGIATLDLKACPDQLDTVGKIMDGVIVQVLDEDGAPLPAGEVGQIAAITPMPMDGYFNRDDLTDAAAFRDSQGRRYIRTGDVGRVDGDGFLRITGRARDMIISGGLNVFASDIEGALEAHPAVAEAAVIAVPSARWGETPHAVVALREGANATVEDLHDWLRPRLSRTSQPSGIDIVPALPRNEMGKVLKRVLREPFWQGHEGAVA
ncbi:MAG: acyl--CoA ligase [Sphingomonadales bacterium]|nr:acyl--CoA ligase [Sphingomonadales bacterium]